MNNQWVKILVFGLLFGVAGYFIGRCGNCGSCGKGDMEQCEAGGKCHHGEGHEGGAQGEKKACCMGEGHGTMAMGDSTAADTVRAH